MPLDLQPYLLRVLEGGEVYPLGDTRPRKVHFRLIAASNRDLRAEVAAGRFRMDLFYRLSVTALQIPPLRERTGDIGALVEHFTRAVALRHGVPIKPCDAPVLAALEAYDWPGNVRELRNVIEGMMLTADGDRLTEQDLPAEIARLLPAAPAGGPLAVTDASLEASERAAICSAILKHSGNLTQTAKDLRISKSTLYLKLRKYGLDRSVQPGGNG
jgi:DNA-binding NtrC family response regulator